MEKKIKVMRYISAVLMIAIGLVHGSGLVLITEKVNDSNVSEMIKSIFPILYLSPTIEMIGLGVITILLPTLDKKGNKITAAILLLIAINAGFAIYLTAWIPAIILAIPIAMLIGAILFQEAESWK